MPLVWATNIINRARKDGLITSDHIVQTILMELSDIRRRLGALIGYDTVSVPLVYTQVIWNWNSQSQKWLNYHPHSGRNFGALYVFYCCSYGSSDGAEWADGWRQKVRGSRFIFSTIHGIAGDNESSFQRVGIRYLYFLVHTKTSFVSTSDG